MGGAPDWATSRLEVAVNAVTLTDPAICTIAICLTCLAIAGMYFKKSVSIRGRNNGIDIDVREADEDPDE